MIIINMIKFKNICYTLPILFISATLIQVAKSGPILQEPRNDFGPNAIHSRSKRDILDQIISVIKMIPGVPPLPYREMIKALNPLRLRVGGDIKGNVKFRKGNMDVIGALGARAGILRMNAGVALGSKVSIGKDGLALSYGGTMGYGSKNQPNGQIANGDTNVPYYQFNSNNVTA